MNAFVLALLVGVALADDFSTTEKRHVLPAGGLLGGYPGYGAYPGYGLGYGGYGLGGMGYGYGAGLYGLYRKRRSPQFESQSQSHISSPKTESTVQFEKRDVPFPSGVSSEFGGQIDKRQILMGGLGYGAYPGYAPYGGAFYGGRGFGGLGYGMGGFMYRKRREVDDSFGDSETEKRHLLFPGALGYGYGGGRYGFPVGYVYGYPGFVLRKRRDTTEETSDDVFERIKRQPQMPQLTQSPPASYGNAASGGFSQGSGFQQGTGFAPQSFGFQSGQPNSFNFGNRFGYPGFGGYSSGLNNFNNFGTGMSGMSSPFTFGSPMSGMTGTGMTGMNTFSPMTTGMQNTGMPGMMNVFGQGMMNGMPTGTGFN